MQYWSHRVNQICNIGIPELEEDTSACCQFPWRHYQLARKSALIQRLLNMRFPEKSFEIW
jgi:hypothetical protein